ncbi:MAG: SDR family NAD(P)-dependent oxidoreductase [Dehalococcoidia bacterium]|nr:SDR family NAD(P)-dependent oxidoreductase [Dehalococcoidia bacterium]
MADERRVAVVTGASSGIGEACCRSLADAGFHVVAGARRLDRLEALAVEIGCDAFQLDVTDLDSVNEFAAQIPKAGVLVNNAGAGFGSQPISDFDEDAWRRTWETNVLGVMFVTRALLPKLEASGNGHIVNIGSTTATDVLPTGGSYAASKHALRAISRTLRLELLGKPVRISQVNPGLVETEFYAVRLGDAEKGQKMYEGYTPLTAQDIADCVTFTVTRPPHVNIDELLVKPLDQAAIGVMNRRPAST